MTSHLIRTILKIHWLSAALLVLLLSHAVLGQAQGNCSTIVKSAQDAASRADWVIEADINHAIKMNAPASGIEVSFENAKVIYELQKSPRFFTGNFHVDSCFPNGEATFWSNAGMKLTGKRMRFFGTRQYGRGRFVFFMQPVSEAMPAINAERKVYQTKYNSPIAMKTGPDGWSRARSTEGRFSIEMPGPFVDITRGDDAEPASEPAFMLRGADHNGSVFIAVFERSGPDSTTGLSFDGTISEPGTKAVVFKGAEAVRSEGHIATAEGENNFHSIYFRVPGGTYMLGVTFDKKHEAESLKVRERFFNSLVFE